MHNGMGNSKNCLFSVTPVPPQPPPAGFMYHFHSFMISCASQPGPTLLLLLLLACLLMCVYVSYLCYDVLLPPLFCLCCFPVQYYSALNMTCVLLQTFFPYLLFCTSTLLATFMCNKFLLYS